MKVDNIRLGFACNSSSTHSLIYVNKLAVDYDCDDFGWNFFTAGSYEAKKKYLSAMLKSNTYGLPYRLKKFLFDNLDLYIDDYCSIDHQSIYLYPKMFGTDIIDIDFIREFNNLILQDNIAILGGNDNDEISHRLYDSDKEVDFGNYHTEMSSLISRKDGDYWTLFDRLSGNRFSFSFLDNPKPLELKTPYLIDIKITDYCDKGCPFCYQNSTINGKHGDYYYKLINNIIDAEVFEVALGGGEPTKHPHFVDILKQFENGGVVPNFTTKSLDWLEDEFIANQVIPIIGSFAFSASVNGDISEIQRIFDIFKYRKYPMHKFTIQIIPAVLSEYNLGSIIDFCYKNRIALTLLGYKDSGRGSKYKELSKLKSWSNPFNESMFLNVLAKKYENGELFKISIDTTLASRYKDKFDEIGIPNWMIKTKEGEVSMYIDVVNRTYSSSSYSGENIMEYNPYQDSIQDMFSKVEAIEGDH